MLHKGKVSSSCKYNRTLVIDSTSRTQIIYDILLETHKSLIPTQKIFYSSPCESNSRAMF